MLGRMSMSRLVLAVPCLALLSCSGASRASAPSASEAAAPLTDQPSPAAPPPPVASVTTKRTVVSLKRPSGTSVITRTGDRITTVLHVLENGRGPHVEAQIDFAADGTIAALEAKGHHSFGAPFNARFSLEGGAAKWQSEEETGSQAVSAPAFFLPVAEIPELTGSLVQAALRHGGTLALLPGGTAKVEKTGELQIAANGESRTVIGYEISGVELSPVQTWMNPDGSWFGSVSEWFSVVPEGWEPSIDALVLEQRRLIRQRDARLASELAHQPPAAGLAYTHARVLDVERGRWIADQTVLVVGGLIKAIGPSRAVVVPAEAEVVDLGGKALIPGMVDMHAHLSDEDGVLNLASGVTTVRDVGNDPDKLDDFKERYDAGTAIGPRVIRFGFIEGRNDKAASSTVTAETAEEAQAAVKLYADRKYEGVKIYNSIKPELVPVIAAAAHERGLAVTGHIPVHMLAHEAVRAGYDGIEHINMLFLNFFATHETDTRDTTRFTLVGDKAADFDLGSKAVRDFIKLLVQRKVVIDPTNNAFEDLLVAEQGKIVVGLEAMTARLPVQTRRFYLMGGLPLDDEKRVRYKASFDKLLVMTKVLYEAKVRLVIGTDALAGLMYHHELSLYARANIPNAAILRMATIDPARYLGLDERQGSIAVGKVADLVVVDGDPLAKMSDIGKVVSTMRGGVVFSSEELFRTVGVAPHAQAR